MEPIELAEYVKECLDAWISIRQVEVDGSERKAPSVMVTDSDGDNFEIVVEGF